MEQPGAEAYTTRAIHKTVPGKRIHIIIIVVR